MQQAERLGETEQQAESPQGVEANESDDVPLIREEVHPLLLADQCSGTASSQDTSDDQQTQTRKHQQRALIILNCLGAFAVNTLISAVSPFFPSYAATRLHARIELVGLAIAIFPLVSVLSSPAVGWACSRYSRGIVALVGSVVLAAGTLSFGLATTIPLCIVARAVQGVGAAAVNISTTALLMQGCSTDLTRALATQELWVGLGYIAGPAVGGVLYSLGGFLATFAVLSALPAAFAIALPTLLRLAGVPLVSLAESLSTGSTSKEDAGAWYAAVRRLLKITAAMACCTCSLLYSTAFGFLDVSFERHLELSLGTPPFLTGLCCSMPSLTYILGCGVVVPISERWGFRNTIIAGLCLMALSMWLLAPMPAVFRPLFVARWVTWTLWVVALLLLGFGIALLLIPSLPCLQEAVQAKREADKLELSEAERAAEHDASSSVYAAFMSSGEVLGPVVGAAAIAHFKQLPEVTCYRGEQLCKSGTGYAATAFGCVVLFCAVVIAAAVPAHLGKVDRRSTAESTDSKGTGCASDNTPLDQAENQLREPLLHTQNTAKAY